MTVTIDIYVLLMHIARMLFMLSGICLTCWSLIELMHLWDEKIAAMRYHTEN